MKSLFIAFIITSSALFANGTVGGFDMMQLAPIVLIFIIFYFLIMRPQQKKAQAHQAMLKELRRGDRVVTAGGILGTIDKVVNEGEISLEIAESVKVRVLKATVSSIVSKPQPVGEFTKQSSAKTESEPKLVVVADRQKKSPEKARPNAKITTKKPTTKAK